LQARYNAPSWNNTLASWKETGLDNLLGPTRLIGCSPPTYSSDEVGYSPPKKESNISSAGCSLLLLLLFLHTDCFKVKKEGGKQHGDTDQADGCCVCVRECIHKAHAVGVNYFLLLFASVIQFEGNNQKCGELGSLYALHRTSEKNTSAQQQSSSQMARGGGYFEAEALLKARETHVCNENDVEEEGFWPQDRVSSPE